MKAFVRPQVAVDYLRDVGFSIGKDTLQLGLQQRVFPFGDYIKAPDRKSTRLNSSHANESRMPSSA